jgi:hypothetical protein
MLRPFDMQLLVFVIAPRVENDRPWLHCHFDKLFFTYPPFVAEPTDIRSSGQKTLIIYQPIRNAIGPSEHATASKSSALIPASVPILFRTLYLFILPACHPLLRACQKHVKITQKNRNGFDEDHDHSFGFNAFHPTETGHDFHPPSFSIIF